MAKPGKPPQVRPDARTLAAAHGLYNVISGVWPLVHMRSFEAVSGPKADRWLVRTVAGLLVTNGLVQLHSSSGNRPVNGAAQIGIGTAATLAAIDLRYGIPGRIRRIYLADAVVELGWIAAWIRAASDLDDGGGRSSSKDVLKGAATRAEA